MRNGLAWTWFRHFFNRITSPQNLRPTLSALTPVRVLEWLTVEEMLDEFVILEIIYVYG